MMPARRAGRPRSFDRAEALDKAILLFWTHGYDGVSIAMLTGAIGIAPPSLYAAFGSKAELYREAIAQYAEHDGGGEGLPEDASAFETVRTALERGVRVVSQPGKPRGCMISAGMLASGPENQELVREIGRVRTAFRERLEGVIACDVNAGLLPATVDAAALARFYAAVMQGMAIQALDGATAAELRAMTEVALQAWPSPE